jgi:high-affinity nickel permease
MEYHFLTLRPATFLKGFDTASSIALLAISAIAKKSSDGKQIPPGYIIVLPVITPRSYMTSITHCT